MSVYQIAIFADGAESYAATLRATIQRNIEELGIPTGMLSFLDEELHRRPLLKIPDSWRFLWLDATSSCKFASF